MEIVIINLKGRHKMKRKLISIVVCMLMCATVLSVAGTVNKNTGEMIPVSNGLCPGIERSSYVQPSQFKEILGKGKIVYGNRAYPSPPLDLVKFDLTAPGTINLITASTATNFLAGGCWVAGVWWCCEYAGTGLVNSNIWKINPTTGAMTLVAASGSTESLNGIDYDDTTSTMYACGGTKLFTINMATGAATSVGPFGGGVTLMIGIACNSNGNLYGIDIGTDSLYSINKATGAATLIAVLGGGLNLNYAQDIAFDKDANKLYLAALTIQSGNEGALYYVNHTTAATTKIGLLGATLTEIVGFAIPYTSGPVNEPPTTPAAPTGPTSGNVGVPYSFTATTTDPEGDNISYKFDWGNGNYSAWLGPYASGTPKTEAYTWNAVGVYNVKVKAKDEIGAESNWSAAHTISITSSAPAIEIQTITGGLLKVKAKIKNTGTSAATNVSWKIELTGGLILLGKESTGKIPTINAGATADITSKLILGFGKTVIKVTADTATKSVNATVLLVFIKI